MLVTINQGTAEITLDFEAAIKVSLEPGIWVTNLRGADISVTRLTAALIAGKVYLAYPKGVARKANGAWSAQERSLFGLLPEGPREAWEALPAGVRDAVEDAYLLARDALPDRIAPAGEVSAP